MLGTDLSSDKVNKIKKIPAIIKWEGTITRIIIFGSYQCYEENKIHCLDIMWPSSRAVISGSSQ